MKISVNGREFGGQKADQSSCLSCRSKHLALSLKVEAFGPKLDYWFQDGSFSFIGGLVVRASHCLTLKPRAKGFNPPPNHQGLAE